MTCVAGAVENETEVGKSIFGKRSFRGGRRAARRASRGKNLWGPAPIPLGAPEKPAGRRARRALGLVRRVQDGLPAPSGGVLPWRVRCVGERSVWWGRPPLAGLPPAYRPCVSPPTAMAQRVFAYRGAGGRVVVDLPPLRPHAPGVCVFKSQFKSPNFFGKPKPGAIPREALRRPERAAGGRLA